MIFTHGIKYLQSNYLLYIISLNFNFVLFSIELHTATH